MNDDFVSAADFKQQVLSPLSLSLSLYIYIYIPLSLFFSLCLSLSRRAASQPPVGPRSVRIWRTIELCLTRFGLVNMMRPQFNSLVQLRRLLKWKRPVKVNPSRAELGHFQPRLARI